jgi:hypothetical protein
MSNSHSQTSGSQPSGNLYIVYDGRARYDEDEATVLVSCDTLEEAKGRCPEFGDCVVFEYDIAGESTLINGRLVYDPQE